MESSSINPPINFAVERKWLLAVTSFVATSFVLNIIKANDSCLILTPSQWNSEDGENLLTS